MTLVGLHFKAQLQGGTLSDNAPVLSVMERGSGAQFFEYDHMADNRDYTSYDVTSYGVGHEANSFIFNAVLVTSNDVDITADVTIVDGVGTDDGRYLYWDVGFDAGLVEYAIYADMSFTLLRTGSDREFRFGFDNAFGGGPDQLFVSDVYFDVGGIPSLRMNQRDDGQGPTQGHARLNNGSANQPSSVGNSRSPRLTGTEANRYV